MNLTSADVGRKNGLAIGETWQKQPQQEISRGNIGGWNKQAERGETSGKQHQRDTSQDSGSSSSYWLPVPKPARPRTQPTDMKAWEKIILGSSEKKENIPVEEAPVAEEEIVEETISKDDVFACGCGLLCLCGEF